MSKTLATLTVAALVTAGVATAQPRDLNERRFDTPGAETFTGEAWVDNWFALWVNGTKLLEDSVPITTERSFNAERFTFNADRPVTLAFEFRDFMENATGLEYIGTRRQQMGDGGAIVQIRDASGAVVLTSDTDWRCVVVQAAPADPSCEKERAPGVDQGACAQTVTAVPADWMAPGFDASNWPQASAHSEREVRPKDGFDRIDWDRNAQLIWGADLKRDNVLYCRITLD